jgi:hypothetical protein
MSEVVLSARAGLEVEEQEEGSCGWVRDRVYRVLERGDVPPSLEAAAPGRELAFDMVR